MAKRKQTYIIILVSLFIVYVGAELFRPKEIDWSINYGKDSKIPFGCYILRHKLSELVSGISVSENSNDLYRAFHSSQPQKSSLCIITDQFTPDKSDLKSLLRYVEEGNYAFIAAQNFDGLLGDTLNLESTYKVSESVDAANKLKLCLENRNIPEPRTFTFKKIAPYYFSSVDTVNTTILEKDSSGRVTYIRTKFGKGFFFLHANPLVFTNYHILYNSSEYPSRSLAYLANRPLIWDEYYKPGHAQKPGVSPLRYILSQEPLRYAYILFVLTWIIFVVFVGKRKQRIIAVYEKPKNQSLDFIETVSQLYYNRRNHSDIVQKKIAHFADYVHSVFYLKFQPDDAAFRRDFALKANIPEGRVHKLMDTLVKLQHAENVSDSQLMNFITEIDSFQYQNQRLIQK
jgi:hypothetical protein